jgi:hypothetical protein
MKWKFLASRIAKPWLNLRVTLLGRHSRRHRFSFVGQANVVAPFQLDSGRLAEKKG